MRVEERGPIRGNRNIAAQGYESLLRMRGLRLAERHRFERRGVIGGIMNADVAAAAAAGLTAIPRPSPRLAPVTRTAGVWLIGALYKMGNRQALEK